MSAEHGTTATGSTEEAVALLKACGLTYRQGNVAVADNEWIVMIYEWRKRPPIKRWLGWPVRYMLGGGLPRPFAAFGEVAPR